MRTSICASRQRRRAALAAVAALLALTAAPTVRGDYFVSDPPDQACQIFVDGLVGSGARCYGCAQTCCKCDKGKEIHRFGDAFDPLFYCRKKCNSCDAGKSVCSHQDRFGSGDTRTFKSCTLDGNSMCPDSDTGSCAWWENKPFDDYWEGGILQDYCTSCGAGYYANGPSEYDGSAWNANTCTACPTGTSSVAENSGNCFKCTRGKYADSIASSSCKSCPAGKHTTTIGADHEDDCVHCPAGKINAAAGSTCTACVAGKKANTANTACDFCGANEYSSAQSDSCTACGAGSYTDGATSSHGPIACYACPAGKYSLTALTAESDCIVCPAGFYCTGATAKTSCAAGSDSPAQSDDAGDCNACTSGWRDLDAVGACVDCVAGKYFASGWECSSCAAGCTNCAAGKYSTAVGATDEATCEDCAGGLNSLPGSASASDCASCDPNLGEYSCYAQCDAGETCAQCQLPLTITTASRADGLIENVCGECSAGAMALAPNPLADDSEFNDAADITLEWHIDLYDAGLSFRENDGITSSKAWQTTVASGCVGVRPGFARLKKYAPLYNLRAEFTSVEEFIDDEENWVHIDGLDGYIHLSYYNPFAVYDHEGNTPYLGWDFGWCQRITEWIHTEDETETADAIQHQCNRQPNTDVESIPKTHTHLANPMCNHDCLFAVQDLQCRPPFYCESNAFVAVQCDNENNKATGSCGRPQGHHGEILTANAGAASSMKLCPTGQIILNTGASTSSECEVVSADFYGSGGSTVEASHIKPMAYLLTLPSIIRVESDVWQGEITGHDDRETHYIDLIDKDRLNSLYVTGKYYCSGIFWGIHTNQHGATRDEDGVIKEDFRHTDSSLRTASTPPYAPPCELCDYDAVGNKLYKPNGNAIGSRRCERCDQVQACDTLKDYHGALTTLQIRVGCGDGLLNAEGMCSCGLKRYRHDGTHMNGDAWYECKQCSHHRVNHFKAQILNAPAYRYDDSTGGWQETAKVSKMVHPKYSAIGCAYCPPGFNSKRCPDSVAENNPDHDCHHCHPCPAGTRSDGLTVCFEGSTLGCDEITNVMSIDQTTGMPVSVANFNYNAVGAWDCATCGAGHYFNTGLNQCVECETGKYNLADGASGTPPHINTRLPNQCDICSSGQCASDKYMASCSSTTGVAVCADIPDCGAGFYWSTFQQQCTACAACQAGYERQGCGGQDPGVCSSCDYGVTYITSAHTTCQNCPTPDSGFGFNQPCTTTSPGTIQACDVGTWGPDPDASNGCTACVGCLPGYHNPCCSSPSGVVDDYGEIFCSKHQGDAGGQCNSADFQCVDLGYPVDAVDPQTRDCVACPTGFYKTDGVGDANNHRLSCKPCDEWRYASSVAGAAGACAFNHILGSCAGASAGTCIQCDDFGYHDCVSDTCMDVPVQSRRVTSASVASCGNQQGHELVSCGTNAIDRPNSDHPEECFCQLNWEWKTDAGQFACEPCGTSMYGIEVTTGGVARAVCTPCPAHEGHNSLHQPASACRCEPGYTGKRKPDDDTKYSGEAGCSACPAGTAKLTRSTNNHRTVDGAVHAADECTLCSGGTYAPEASDTCTDCPAGSYCPPNSALPIPCPDGKTSAAGSDNAALCYCADGQTLSVTTGKCTLNANVCATDHYAHVEACAASAAAAGEPTLAAALATSNPGLTQEQVWHVDLLRRVDWMQQQGTGAKTRQRVHIEVMPAPPAADGKARLAVVYEFAMYESFCSLNSQFMTLRLTHTKTTAPNQFWDCDTASGSCTLPEIEVEELSIGSLTPVLVDTISTAQAYYADYKYVLVDMGDAADLQDPADPAYTAAQWTMALMHCCQSVVDKGQLSQYPVVSGSEYDDTGPFYAQCVLPDARAQIEAVMATCKLTLASDDFVDSDCATPTGVSDVIAKFSPHVGGSVATLTDHTDYLANINLMPHECKSDEPHAAISNCVLNVKIYKYMGFVALSLTGDSWAHDLSFHSTPPRQVAGWLRAPGRQEFAQSTLVDIEYCAPPSDSSAYPSSVYDEHDTPKCVTVSTPTFVPSAAASSGAIFETSTHGPAETLSWDASTYRDCYYTRDSYITHKSNKLCLTGVPTSPFEVQMTNNKNGLQCVDTCGSNSIICDCDIQHCLTGIGSMLVHAPLLEDAAAGGALVEGPYYHALRSGRDSSNIMNTAQHSKHGEARYEHLEALGVIIEGRQRVCHDDAANPVQERLYLPFDQDIKLSLDHLHIKNACNTADIPSTLQGALEQDVVCPDSLCLFNTARAYFARIELPSEHTQVRMRTWTAYALGPYSEWRDLESWERGSCAPCPEFSSSPANSAACTDCECDAGHGYLGSAGCPACAPCPSGTYKISAGNHACTECNPGDNAYYVTDPGATAADQCALNDPAEAPTTLLNFDHNGLPASAEPLVLCVNFDTARAAALAASPALVENRCAAINVCASSHTPEPPSLAPDTWHHREHVPFSLESVPVSSGADTYDTLDAPYNHHSIEYARIPRGVTLRTCVPDFDYYRVHTQWACDPATERAFAGTCDLSDPATSPPTCVQSVQHDLDTTTPTPTANPLGATQLFRFALDADHTCAATAPAQRRFVSAPPLTWPAAHQPCAAAEVVHGSVAADCALTCDPGYQATADDCEPKFRAEFTAACTGFQYASETFTDGAFTRFLCVSCKHVPGSSSGEWDPAQPTVCQTTACAPGHVTPPSAHATAPGLCAPCPAHHYQHPETTGNICAPCDLAASLHQPSPGSDQCVACNWGTHSLTCAPGFQLVADRAAAAAFLAQYPGFPDRSQAWCAAGAACLPCPPGHFELASTCQPCALGAYQNNFAQTACEPCGAGQTTPSTASTTSAACVCAPGAAAQHFTAAHELGDCDADPTAATVCDWKLAEQASVDWRMPDAIAATKVLTAGNARFAHQFILSTTLGTTAVSWASPIFASANTTVTFAFDASADATLVGSSNEDFAVADDPEWPGLLALNPTCGINKYRTFIQTYKMITLAEAQADYPTICAEYDTRPPFLGVCCLKSDTSSNCVGGEKADPDTVIAAGNLPPQLYVQYPMVYAKDLSEFWHTFPRPAWLSPPQNIRPADPADSCSTGANPWSATKSAKIALHDHLPSTMLVLWERPANRGYGDEYNSCSVQNTGQITSGRPGCGGGATMSYIVRPNQGGNGVTAYDLEVTTAAADASARTLLFKRTCTSTDTLIATDIQALPHAPAFPTAWCHIDDRLAAVPGLTRGQQYYVRMRAHFTYGSSGWSPRALVLFAPVA